MKNIPFSPPDITEEEIAEVVDTLKSGWITTGPKTKLFEKRVAEYCGTNKAVALNSATACMEMTLRVLGVGPGDEVITTAYTYTATASAIYHVGAQIVMVDSGENSYEIDYDEIANKITDRTKVIIPVDIAGVMCNYNKVFEVVESKKNLFKPANNIQEKMGRITVMADGAHSFGASQFGKMSGAVADFTAFSFHAVKNLTTGEGGAVTWQPIEGISDEDIYKNYMLLSLHGQSKDALEKTKLGSWEYDILSPNFKCNMTDIMASIGLIQLNRYDKMLSRRKEIIEMYYDGFKDTNISCIQHFTEGNKSSGHLFLTRIDGIAEEERNSIIQKLAEKGISSNVHYKPLPLLTAYKDLGFDIQDYPNAHEQYKNGISLPLHTLLTDKEVRYIIEKYKKIIDGESE
ncbi:DegT/DnrJ/EryC1/StrS aminotransferase family protein [Vagococcus sp. PNs007]|uniref:DegT/DnrJ/EryC1/StrS aminotransferase family protein n=1 Tax=Vagococcus proximus TaxID=2991417 RepID=A0ABT5X001_9ENTE|nr:DegT/DnrJ/EryC1/StrS aminotransferase family protein [Vagococcus proximus]MDF0479333.1 DegT/DnrJ/EryC1/StrS aminotransferase family protein [Vagococcus proximus]